MYNVRNAAILQRFCRSVYCCRRDNQCVRISNAVTAYHTESRRTSRNFSSVSPLESIANLSSESPSEPTGIIHSELYEPSANPNKDSEGPKVSNRHHTPSSDLSVIYKEVFNSKHKEIFGDSRNTARPITRTHYRDFTALNPSLVKRLEDLGYDKPLPVQSKALEATLIGKDAVITSATGSGKTLAFVVPMLNKVGAQRGRGRRPQAIIVAPTREICRQITQVVEEITGSERLMTMIAGGDKVRKQAKEARRGEKDIIIATPTRVMQLISMNIIRPEDLKFLVLDEADELLVDLFYTQLRWILDHSNPAKQMIVTTATVPPNVQFIIDRYMKYHEYIDSHNLGSSVSMPATIQHKAVLYTHEQGVLNHALQWVLSKNHTGCTMVFVKYKDDCSRMTELIRDWGYSAKFINSDVPESSRVSVMEEFSSGEFEVLVATDLAGRGVDVPECGLVVHVKPALDTTKYIHRSGRTGRAGRSGVSVVMLMYEHQNHMDFLQDLSQIAEFEYFLQTKSQRYQLKPKT